MLHSNYTSFTKNKKYLIVYFQNFQLAIEDLKVFRKLLQGNAMKGFPCIFQFSSGKR